MTVKDSLLLEDLIDANGLDEVLFALSEICDEKSMHIQESYSDSALADAWRKAGSHIIKAENAVNKLGI